MKLLERGLEKFGGGNSKDTKAGRSEVSGSASLHGRGPSSIALRRIDGFGFLGRGIYHV